MTSESASEPKTSMHIDPYERGWMIVSAVTLIVFAVTVTIAAFAMGIQLPSPEARVDPRTIANQGELFAAENLGLKELAPGQYEAYVLAQVWSFTPNTITVPLGSEVTFYITSRDVQHGFMLQNSNLNVMVIPGHISKMTVQFDTPGEFNFICHEYCGSGHAIMFGKVVVEP